MAYVPRLIAADIVGCHIARLNLSPDESLASDKRSHLLIRAHWLQVPREVPLLSMTMLGTFIRARGLTHLALHDIC